MQILFFLSVYHHRDRHHQHLYAMY